MKTIYQKNYLEEFIDNDEISEEEAGFMLGYIEADAVC